MSAQGVAVVGSFVVGLTLRADRFPVSGETVLAREFDMGPGGKGSNQAVQVARLGTPVEFIGVIGDDDFGRIAVDLYSDEGVGTKHLTTTPDRNTGVGFIVLDPAGDNRILLDPGSNEVFGPEHVRAARDALESSAVVIAQLEIPAETARAGMAAGKEAGSTTILNPAPVRPIPEDVFAHVDILTPNQTEARVLLGLDPDDPSDDLDLCRRLLDLGVGAVILTRGEAGAVIVAPGGDSTVEPFRVEVTDSTGAGDAFNGTLAASLANGMDLPDSARRAAAAGALACTKLGVIPALPDAAAVDGLVAR
ncbi:MAG TPA: ribokinase [Actinomycetota bacterium]|nr:ribokinase [Actinomycetota bacterium]